MRKTAYRLFGDSIQVKTLVFIVDLFNLLEELMKVVKKYEHI